MYRENIYLLKAAHDQKDPSLTDGSFFNFGLIKLFYTKNSLEIMDNSDAKNFIIKTILCSVCSIGVHQYF